MLAMHGVILMEKFVKTLQLKRFNLNFERILNRKWLLSYRNSEINFPRNFELIDAIWFVLMYHFDQI